MSPTKGKAGPGEGVPFVVTLKASVHASFYSMDLVCKVGPAPESSWGQGVQLPALEGGVGYETPRPPDRVSPWKGGGPTAQAQGKAWL